eukprot:4178959-Prymnesium_polylepis.2
MYRRRQTRITPLTARFESQPERMTTSSRMPEEGTYTDALSEACGSRIETRCDVRLGRFTP